MSIESEVTSMTQNIQADYEGLENIGADLTGINKNIQNIRTCLDTVWNNLPKVSNEGTEVTLTPTLKGKLGITPKGNSIQEGTPTPSIPFPIKNVTGNNNVCVGTDINVAKVPSEYQPVEYIEGTGTQYINTGYTFTSGKFKIETVFANSLENPSSWNTLSGTQIGSGNTAKRSGLIQYQYQDTRLAGGSIGASSGISLGNLGTTKHTLEITYNETSQGYSSLLDGTSSQTKYSTTSFITGLSNPLFAKNTDGTISEYGNYKLYSYTIIDNDITVRAFIPCYRISDNEIGLYDVVNNVFYTNSGTGTFNKGNNVDRQTKPLNLGTIELNKIGTYQDYIYKSGDKWYKHNAIRKLELAIADMDNTDNYPGWKGKTQIVNDLFITSSGYGVETTIAYCNIRATNYLCRINTNGLLYLSRNDYGNDYTQTYWKTNYANLIYKLCYAITNIEAQDDTELTDTTLISQLEDIDKMQGYNGTTIITSTYSEGNAQMIISGSGLKGE